MDLFLNWSPFWGYHSLNCHKLSGRTSGALIRFNNWCLLNSSSKQETVTWIFFSTAQRFICQKKFSPLYIYHSEFRRIILETKSERSLYNLCWRDLNLISFSIISQVTYKNNCIFRTIENSRGCHEYYN